MLLFHKDGLINIVVSRNIIKDMLGRADALWTLAKLQLTEWIWNSFMVSAPIGLMRDDSISRADGEGCWKQKVLGI